MALEDRERNFEKALERQLRANAGAGLDCPDAETLAAYHDRMLSAQEMVSLKSHIAACPNCQDILATLEVTEAIPVQTKDSEKSFADEAPAGPAAAHASPVISAADRDAARAAKSSPVREVVREMPKPKSYLRWVAPAGAIAAGLLIWVAINANRPSQKMANQASAPVEVAENRKATEPEREPKLADRVTEPKGSLEETLRAENEVHRQVGGLPETDKELRLERSRVSPNSAYQHGPAMTQNQVQNQIQNNGNLDQSEAYEYRMPSPPATQRAISPQKNAPAAAAKSQVTAAAAPSPAPVASGSGAGNGVGDAAGERKDQANAATETVEVTGSAPAASFDQKKNKVATQETDKLAVNNRSVQETAQLESGVEANAASVTASKEKQAAEAGRAQLKKEEAVFQAGAGVSVALRDADAFWLSVVRTTNAKVFWVISREGEVFRSEDGGKSSRKQEIPAGIKAIAGSATDAKVCWILAEKSIAVRTADGGKHWASVNVSASSVLTTIAAQDAMHAVVSDASGKTSYSTSDGGSTWNLVTQ